MRVFDGATGRWRITRLGKRWFAQNELTQFVVQLPCKFYTTKADGRVVEHEGWYPVTDLDHNQRRRIEALTPAAPPPPGAALARRNASIQEIKTQ